MHDQRKTTGVYYSLSKENEHTGRLMTTKKPSKCKFALSICSEISTRIFVSQCKQPLTVHVQSLVELLMYAKTLPCCSISGMQLALELLTPNDDGSAVVLQKIGTSNTDMFINFYEILQVVQLQVSWTFKCAVHRRDAKTETQRSVISFLEQKFTGSR